MPRVPRYEATRGIPAQAPVVRGDIGTAGAEFEALGKLGKVVGQIGLSVGERALELKQQDEDNYIIEQANTFDDSMLSVFIEARSKTGKDAIGNVGRLQALSDKQQRAILDKTPSHLQDALRQKLEVRSQHYEKRLATHEAVQRRVVNEINANASKENAAKKAYNIADSLVGLDETALQVAAFIGTARVESEQLGIPFTPEDRSAIYASAIDGMIDSNPYRANELLNIVRPELSAKHERYYGKAIPSAVKAADKEKERLKNKEKADKKEAEDAIAENWRQTVHVPKLADGTLTIPDIRNAPIPGKEKDELIRQLMTREKARAAGKDDPYEITNPKVYGTVSYAINTDPGSVTVDEIWDLHGKGLSTDDCQKFQKLWEQKTKDPKPEKDARQSNLIKKVERDRKDGVYGSVGKVESDIKAGAAANEINEAFRVNPDMTEKDAELLYKNVTESDKRNWIERLLNTLRFDQTEEEKVNEAERAEAIKLLSTAPGGAKPLTEANIQEVMKRMRK